MKLKNSITRPPQVVPRAVDSYINNFPPETKDQLTTTLGPVERFLKRAGNALTDIDQVRKTQLADPTATDEGKAVNTWNYAKGKRDELTDMYQKVKGTTSAKALELESEISRSLQTGADGEYANEARSRIASMPDDERISFVTNALKNGDVRTAQAVFGRPGWFSGLSDTTHSKLKRQFVETVYAEEVATIKQLKKLDGVVEKGYSETVRQISKLQHIADSGGAIAKSEAAKQALSK